MGINIKTSTANPVANDIGNKEIQARIVSKTIQCPLFTVNRNAVWAGRQQLRKESYPLATLSFPANRNVFRLEVGDPFKFSCAQYGIVDMICRVARIAEEGPDTENITIQAIQDVYSISNAVTAYTVPTNHAQEAPNYTETPFINQRVVEAPYVLTEGVIGVLAFAERETDYQCGFNLYLSTDGGVSYVCIETLDNIVPYGTLNANHPRGVMIDEEGIIIDFEEDEEDVITSTWADVLAGTANLGILGGEIISWLTITPITTTQVRLENVIWGRFGTQRVDHTAGEKLYVITNALDVVVHAEIVNAAVRKFKLVPFNVAQVGDIADATAVDLTIAAKALTPYIPSNFCANGSNAAARYDDDIVLTWSPRYRGRGAGIGIPGEVLPEATREGYFTIKVYMGGTILVRTATAIDAETWTYTEAMNLADNAAVLADYVTFKISNYRTDGSTTYTSDEATVVCYLNP